MCALVNALIAVGAKVVTGGASNHLMVLDTVAAFGLDGRRAEEALDAIGITANKQVIPDDPNPPLRPSGVRLGTPACTTRGMGAADMRLLADRMLAVLRAPHDAALVARLADELRDHCRAFPVPGVAA